MYLFCLKCKANYKIPHWILKYITYQEYSYCDKCYKERFGKSRGFIAKLFTSK
jgi:hypothetical protein